MTESQLVMALCSFHGGSPWPPQKSWPHFEAGTGSTLPFALIQPAAFLPPDRSVIAIARADRL